MTCDIQDRSIGDVLELLIEQGLDGTAEAISILLNEAMRLEGARHIPQHTDYIKLVSKYTNDQF